jgi:hypothetical protein
MENDGEQIRAAIEEITSGFSSVREVIKGLKQKSVLLQLLFKHFIYLF